MAKRKKDAVSRIIPVTIDPETAKTYKLGEDEYLKYVGYIGPEVNKQFLEIHTDSDEITVKNFDRKYEHKVFLHIRKIIEREVEEGKSEREKVIESYEDLVKYLLYKHEGKVMVGIIGDYPINDKLSEEMEEKIIKLLEEEGGDEDEN